MTILKFSNLLLVFIAFSLASNALAQNASCADCKTNGCLNFGDCNAGPCTCKYWFGGEYCTQAYCEGRNVPLDRRTLKPATNASTECCSPGYTGLQCNVCQQDSVCNHVPVGDFGETGICQKKAKVWKNEHWLHCRISAPQLTPVFPGLTQISYVRNLTAGTGFVSAFYRGRETFYCETFACEQYVSGRNIFWECANIKCKCVPGSGFCGANPSADLSSLINDDFKNKIIMKCPRNVDNPQNCTLDIQDLRSTTPDGLDMTECSFGECALAKDEPADIQAAPSTGLSTTEAAAVAVFSVLTAAIIAGIGLSKRQQILLKKKSNNINVEGGRLEFKEIKYRLPVRKTWRQSLLEKVGLKSTTKVAEEAIKPNGHKVVLDGISGCAQRGRVLAVMGPSGSGKSTLLDILANKEKEGIVEGEITFNGTPISPKKFKKICGFVNQDDILLPYSTVRETLMFSANMRLPESVTWVEKSKIVDQVIETLRLQDVQHSRIGGNGIRGISGGERRRVSIGVELVTSPAVLFLDEPTSGLDSYSAHMVMQTLVELARKYNKTILCTIHQPRSDIYALFDELLVLRKGRTLFYGPAEEAKVLFSKKGFICPEGYNIADYLIDLAITSPENTSISLMPPPIASAEATVLSIPVELTDIDEFTFGASYWTQFTLLAERNAKNLLRDPKQLAGHLIIAIALGLLIGGIYFKSPQTLAGTQNRVGGLYFVLALLIFSSMSALSAFSEERLVFAHERSNNFYSPFPFYLNKLFFDLFPLRIIPCVVMTTVVYWMMGLSTISGDFLRYLLIMVLFNIVSALLCLLIGANVKDLGMANLVTSILALFMMLFGGLLLSYNNIPAPVSWIQYLSFFRYAYEAIAVNELLTIRVEDTFNGVKVNIAGPLLAQKFFGFDIDSYWRNAIILAGIMVALSALLWCAIFYRLKERR